MMARTVVKKARAFQIKVEALARLTFEER